MEEEDSVKESEDGEDERVGACVAWVTQKPFERGDEPR